MKTAMPLVLCFMLLPLAHASSAGMDGNKMLDSCRYFFEDGIEPSGTKAMLDSAYCAGYVQAVMDVESMTVAINTADHKQDNLIHFCRPEDVSNGQAMKVIGKWLKDHPNKLHWGADTIIHHALSEAFPCR